VKQKKEIKNIAASVKERLRNISIQSFRQNVFDSKAKNNWNPKNGNGNNS